MSGDVMHTKVTVEDFIVYELKEELMQLKSEDKGLRRISLASLKRKIAPKHKEYLDKEYETLVSNTSKLILKSLSDSSESCRELAISILTIYVENVENLDELLTYTIPILVQRLGGKEIVEPSEEIRLLMIKFLSLIIKRYDHKILAFVDGLIQILKNTLVDPFPEIKKESCNCAGILAITLKTHFQLKSEMLIKPILQIMSHQHAKVRCSAIKALGLVILHGDNKSVNDVVTHLAQRFFDQSLIVRKEVTAVVGQWMCELMDRYSFFSKLIPLLLTSIMDEIPEISELAQNLWLKAGEIYSKENEDQNKDQIDFDQIAILPQITFKRSLGCKILAQRYVFYIIPGLINDLKDWRDETRVKASQLLYVVILYVEEKISAYLDKLLPALSISMTETAPETEILKKCCFYIAYFSDTEIWLNVLVPIYNLSPLTANVRVLASLLHGTKELPDKCNEELSSQMLTLVNNTSDLNSIKECVEALLQHPSSIPGYTMFYVIILLQSQKVANADELLEKLVKYQKLSSVEKLHQIHGETLFKELSKDYRTWNSNSVGFQMFASLLVVLKDHISSLTEVVFPVIKLCFESLEDPKLKLRLFLVLTDLLPNLAKGWMKSENSDASIKALLNWIILINLEWRPGKSSQALRSACIILLYKTTTSNLLTKEILFECKENLIARLLSLLDDESQMTRKYTLEIWQQLYPLLASFLDYRTLQKIYTEMITRLDDTHYENRTLAAQFFIILFKPEALIADLDYSAHFPDIFKAILIHMDDSNQEFQESILQVLKELSVYYPQKAIGIVEEEKYKHRNPKYCTILMGHIKNNLQK